MVKLDLACGDSKREGFTGVDKYKTESVDIVHDLSVYPWPFEDSSVDEVHCSHYVEHVVDLCKFWGELWRILKSGGSATIIAPYGKNNRAWQDPTHVRAIVEESFYYLDKNFRKTNKLEHYLGNPDVDFEFVVVYAGVDPVWANRSEESRSFAIKHYWNVIADIQATLKKKG
jgi:SAM-dependent methyltransferase